MLTLPDPAAAPVTASMPRQQGEPSPIAEAVRLAIDELRPHLRRDGGDIELIDIDGDKVIVDLKGTCVGCILSSVTLAGVRKRLIDAVGRPLRVIPLSAVVPLKRMKVA